MRRKKTYVEKRPWGMFEQFTLNEVSTVKILTIKKKEHPSLQYHHRRSEFWRVLDGRLIVTIGKRKRRVKKGDEVFIPKKTLHTATALTRNAKVLEISYGEFDEKDIVRVQDKYGRA
tara:strand:+ start:8573 stop:8923 length:351 start_codon:yes stop_codon:yes gene_type:complete